MARKHRFESDGLQHLFDRYAGTEKKRRAFSEDLSNLETARALYELRKKSRLTQAQLASRVGTSTSVISRLEDANYNGHSLAMLRRIADALGKRVEIRFVEPKSKRSPRSRSMRRTKTERTS